jgi:hypothetical protein
LITTDKPSIVLKFLNIKRPRRNQVVSEVRKKLDSYLDEGRFVFIVNRFGTVWEWGRSTHGPMFQTFAEFQEFYKNEPIEYI